MEVWVGQRLGFLHLFAIDLSECSGFLLFFYFKKLPCSSPGYQMMLPLEMDMKCIVKSQF